MGGIELKYRERVNEMADQHIFPLHNRGQVDPLVVRRDVRGRKNAFRRSKRGGQRFDERMIAAHRAGGPR